MKDELYRSVAMPPTFLFAPQKAAIFSMALQMCIMFITFAMFQINFLWFFTGIFLAHSSIASYGFREPHLDNMFTSLGKIPLSSKNMYSSKGVKLGS